jgi:archaellin
MLALLLIVAAVLVAVLMSTGLITHTYTLGWAGSNGGTPVSSLVPITGNIEINVNETVAHGSTNQQVHIAFVVAKLQSIRIAVTPVSGSTAVALTLKTNSTGSPQETITISATQPFEWIAGSGIPVPFGGDISTMYFTNADGAIDDTLDIKALVNQ